MIKSSNQFNKEEGKKKKKKIKTTKLWVKIMKMDIIKNIYIFLTYIKFLELVLKLEKKVV